MLSLTRPTTTEIYKMSIENQIAVNADEPEQLSATEMLTLMIESEDNGFYLGGEFYYLDDIIDVVGDSPQDLLQASIDSITDNPNAIKELYIKTIQSLME